jgi:hypothetical protein
MKSAVKKITLGQFFTKNNSWLDENVLHFIKSTKAEIAFDPFAGDGHLLREAQKIGFKKTIGLDIDPTLGWQINDSLRSIPKVEKSIIITNPPYLTNYSARRKKIYEKVGNYFESCGYDDLYQLALEKCLSNEFGIMIIPETFVNSAFPKNRLISINIIESDLFDDTQNPVCVICFDNKNKNYEEVKIYKNGVDIGNLQQYEKMRKIPRRNVEIKFNSSSGQIALRAVDTTNPQKPIAFMKKEEIDYDLSSIKHSSRLITLIELKTEKSAIDQIIKCSNQILFDFRRSSKDVLLSPFKGNKKNGERRRRLDYATARAILESACEEVESDNLKLL